jgi:hypothetical protein
VDSRTQGAACSRKRDAQQALPERMIVQKKDEANQQTGNKYEYGRGNADNGFGPATRRVQPFRI